VTLVATMCMSACATPASPLSPFPRADGDTPESLLEARRKLVREGYDAQPVTTVVDGVNVRVSEIDMAEAVLRKRVRRPRTEVRVPLQNPWRLHTDQGAYRAGLNAQTADLDLEQTRLSTRACLDGTQAQSLKLATDAWNQHRTDLALLRTWLDELLDERLITAADHRVQATGIQRRLLAARPRVSGLSAAPVDLPALEPPTAAVDLDRGVLEQALAAHPLWARAEAEHAHLTSLARRETSKRLPWLAWVSMGYTPRFAQDRPILEGRFAVEIPLGLDARRKASALELRAAGARLEGEARMLEQLETLRSALMEWATWEARIPALARALAGAQEHRSMALGWIEGRSAKPSEAASLLRDAYEMELSVQLERSRAGVSRCRVIALSGVEPAAWPRGGPQ
jgi:hypothetical protein